MWTVFYLLVRLMQLEFQAPDHSTLSRPIRPVDVPRRQGCLLDNRRVQRHWGCICTSRFTGRKYWSKAPQPRHACEMVVVRSTECARSRIPPTWQGPTEPACVSGRECRLTATSGGRVRRGAPRRPTKPMSDERRAVESFAASRRSRLLSSASPKRWLNSAARPARSWPLLQT